MSQVETHRRSIAKALSWRFIATSITTVLAFLLFGSAAGAAKIGLADLILKLIVYYLHERAWIAIPYGKPKPVEYEI